MNIAALTYTFGTPKIEAGMNYLVCHGFMPKVIMAAPPVELPFYHSKLRITPKGIETMRPRDMAGHYGIPYCETPHNSEEACDVLVDHEIDVAVILGARIIKRPLIDSCEVGILNMHPGLLPNNRGLDNIKWAILLDMPMIATAHLINEHIDMGRFIHQETVEVFHDDTMLDVFLRMQAAERIAMIKALYKIQSGESEFRELAEGTYRKAVPPDLELSLMVAWERYKAKHSAFTVL